MLRVARGGVSARIFARIRRARAVALTEENHLHTSQDNHKQPPVFRQHAAGTCGLETLRPPPLLSLRFDHKRLSSVRRRGWVLRFVPKCSEHQELDAFGLEPV